MNLNELILMIKIINDIKQLVFILMKNWIDFNFIIIIIFIIKIIINKKNLN
jgi:hypothetical protein